MNSALHTESAVSKPLLESVHMTVSTSTGPSLLTDVSIQVHPGESLGIVGESGSGKSTWCKAVLALLPEGVQIAHGEVRIEGQNTSTFTRKRWRELRTRTLGSVFQDPGSYLNPSIAVGKQIAETVRNLGIIDRSTIHAAVEQLLVMVELNPETVRNLLPSQLSGGMQQRVLLALALAGDPRLLVADEATSALDVTVQAEILDLLTRLKRDRDLTIVFVSHDLGVVAEVCDRLVVLYAGEVVESGPTKAILADPRHPYTRALVRISRAESAPIGVLESIDGQPPSVGVINQGCRFQQRCPIATSTCAQIDVHLLTVQPRHEVRCLLAGDASGEGK